MATPGVGTGPHLFGELFEMMTGVDLIHVPYRSNYYPDLLSGQVLGAGAAAAIAELAAERDDAASADIAA
jgi:tripartite-type tricarboxylate transporter receptor subunit TctC